MIVALTSDGEVYSALTQVNTDSSMMMLFISSLAKQLTKEQKDWRSNTVFLLDGASYHKSKETRSMFQSLGISVMLSAPYSYSAAPVELFFANFKKTNINTMCLPTGKR